VTHVIVNRYKIEPRASPGMVTALKISLTTEEMLTMSSNSSVKNSTL
jgi:hypothetical protein